MNEKGSAYVRESVQVRIKLEMPVGDCRDFVRRWAVFLDELSNEHPETQFLLELE